ncbi:MAG: hypothetical protein ACKVZ0_09680 [Gemmatimonadales bacterium]
MSTQPPPPASLPATGTTLAGGVTLVGGAVAFLAVFGYLAARFRYPEVLDGRAEEVVGLLRHRRSLHTAVVAPVAAANNSLLPAWMIGLGGSLILESRRVGRPEA